jgi:endonuclease YncB( thermonuclease family)
MSKHWKPKRTGWAGQWDRHRWAVAEAGGRRGRLRAPRLRWGELRAMLLGGMLLGLAMFHFAPEDAIAPSLPGGGAAGAVMATPALVRVIDGDTFDYDGTRIRIADIDTPEVRGRCAYEIELAARATDRVEVLLGQGAFELRPLPSGRDEDRYGRKLRIVTRDGQSLGDTLVSEGLARTWTGRREPWCV